jgi:DNA-directed RNA polymerase specialized sigma24 family protein
MLTCRSVSPKTWEFARQALIFYFSRRHGLDSAEDLAHETLATILRRDDYCFEQEDDFLKVCYGFASRILQSARRQTGKDADLPGDLPEPRAGKHSALNHAELNVFLNEVLRIGNDELRKSDWQLIQQAAADDGTPLFTEHTSANNARVKLHRARRKLAGLTGWRKGGV